MDALLPKLELSLRDVELWRDGDVESLSASCFPHISTSRYPHLFLEIGFGGGEHVAHMAALYPQVGIIGCETYINGVGDALKHIKEKKLSNIRLFTQDARLLIETLPDACMDKIFILYPDPWPKTRHHKRRIISPQFLDSLARIMKLSAILRLATDHADYCTWMLECLLSHKDFAWNAQQCSDWLSPWPDYTPTRYEKKALAGIPTYLEFTRV